MAGLGLRHGVEGGDRAGAGAARPGCRRQRVRSASAAATLTSEPLARQEAGGFPAAQGAAPGLPLGPKHPAPGSRGVTLARAYPLSKSAYPGAPPREDQSRDSPRSVLTRAPKLRLRMCHPSRERAEGWEGVSESSPDRSDSAPTRGSRTDRPSARRTQRSWTPPAGVRSASRAPAGGARRPGADSACGWGTWYPCPTSQPPAEQGTGSRIEGEGMSITVRVSGTGARGSDLGPTTEEHKGIGCAGVGRESGSPRALGASTEQQRSGQLAAGIAGRQGAVGARGGVPFGCLSAGRRWSLAWRR